MLGDLSLLGYLLTSVDLVHLVLIVDLTVFTWLHLTLSSGGLHGHLMLLLLKEHHLLNLFLGQVLIDHLLLSWEIIALNHLFSAFNLQLLVLRLPLVMHFFTLIHVIMVLTGVFCHLGFLRCLEHHQLVSLFLSKLLTIDLEPTRVDHLFSIVLILALHVLVLVLIGALVRVLWVVLCCVQLRLYQLLELLLWQLESVGILLIFLLEVGEKKLFLLVI